MLRVKLVKSIIGNIPRNRATIKALGLKKIRQEVLVPDNSMFRGMIHQVKHMLQVTEEPDIKDNK